jgi:type IV pilus assembly protein PilX
MMSSMALSHRTPNAIHRAARHSQRGVVMVVTLISLVLLLIGVAAMLRSVDSGALIVGNLAFRRDLTNQADLAIVAAKASLASGGPLSTETARQQDLVAANYSASRLPAAAGSTNGIPAILVSSNAYVAKYGAAIVPTTVPGLTLFYVIDRQCYAAGGYDSATCEYSPDPVVQGGPSQTKQPGANTRPVYRISVRVTGPRNTEAYFQSIYID